MVLLWSSCNLIGIMSTLVYKINKDFEKLCEVLWMGLRPSNFHLQFWIDLATRSWWTEIFESKKHVMALNLHEKAYRSREKFRAPKSWKQNRRRQIELIPHKHFSSARGIYFVLDDNFGGAWHLLHGPSYLWSMQYQEQCQILRF